jgi:hypothetical protein
MIVLVSNAFNRISDLPSAIPADNFRQPVALIPKNALFRTNRVSMLALFIPLLNEKPVSFNKGSRY